LSLLPAAPVGPGLRMPVPSAERLTEHLRRTLLSYDEALLRQVAQRLLRPRSQWPVEELVERLVTALANPVMLDRRLKEMPPACRQLLALIGHSRQPRWAAGHLVELLATLGHDDGLAPLILLLESGLLAPELFPLTADEGAAPAPAPAKVRVKA